MEIQGEQEREHKNKHLVLLENDDHPAEGRGAKKVSANDEPGRKLIDQHYDCAPGLG